MGFEQQLFNRYPVTVLKNFADTSHYTSLRRFVTIETMYGVSDRSSFMLVSEVKRRLDTHLNLKCDAI